jgi:GDPmannose 4,6-dehydratase
MWRMLQQDAGDDYVVATGVSITIREFLTLVFERLGLEWEKYVSVDPRFFRPAEVDYLLGDPFKAKEKLHWSPSTSIKQLAHMMIDSDLALAEEEARTNRRTRGME